MRVADVGRSGGRWDAVKNLGPDVVGQVNIADFRRRIIPDFDEIRLGGRAKEKLRHFRLRERRTAPITLSSAAASDVT